jgi:predicted dehydrogenase
MIRVGVIGYGYWGPNLVRNFMEAGTTTVSAVSDQRPERLKAAAFRYPAVKAYVNAADLINDPGVDAVAIATPVSTHYDLGIQALKAGKHVLIEKPLAETSEQSRRLIDEAARKKRVLIVDHTFVYTGAVRKIQQSVANNELGKIYYYDSVRVNLGLFQNDVNVIWDLAVHDIAIMNHVLPQKPHAVSATGMGHVPDRPANIAYMTLFFQNQLIAHVHVNWLAPVKVRRTLIGGSEKMIMYDDVEPSEKIKIYDKGITVNKDPESMYKLLVSYRSGDMWAPRLDTTEALQTEALHFAQCIERGAAPITDGENGLRVVQILEAATQSMAENGKPVNIG